MKCRHVGRSWLAVLLCVAVSGCGNRETLYHGAEPDPDGGRYNVSSLMPQCGCMTLAVSDEASGVDQIEVVARLHGSEIGSTMLKAGETQRVGFDWAGPENTDVYEVQAYEMAQGGDRAAAPSTSVSSLLSITGIVETSCRARNCSFGELGMSFAYSIPYSVGDDAPHGAVAFVSDGALMRAASPARCGCMIVQNVSSNGLTVNLRSAWNGTRVGAQPLPWVQNVPEQPLLMIGFDHAGPAVQDYYTVSVEHGDQTDDFISINNRENETVSASDNVRLVGSLDDLTCAPEGATFALSVGGNNRNILCEFGPLNLNKMQ